MEYAAQCVTVVTMVYYLCTAIAANMSQHTHTHTHTQTLVDHFMRPLQPDLDPYTSRPHPYNGPGTPQCSDGSDSNAPKNAAGSHDQILSEKVSNVVYML